jgi:hypothetical protein
MAQLEVQIKLQREAYDRTREEAHAMHQEVQRREQRLGVRVPFEPVKAWLRAGTRIRTLRLMGVDPNKDLRNKASFVKEIAVAKERLAQLVQMERKSHLSMQEWSAKFNEVGVMDGDPPQPRVRDETVVLRPRAGQLCSPFVCVTLTPTFTCTNA